MNKRKAYERTNDPTWTRIYGSFPGVAECVRLIEAGKARGEWAEIIVYELADNAGENLQEMVDTFHRTETGDVRLYLLMALEMAALPESTEFLAEVLREGDSRLAAYAERGLKSIDTKKSRRLLYEISHSGHERSESE